MEDVSKCPFCGSQAALYANYSYKSKCYFVFVKCMLCGSQGRIYKSKEDPEETDWKNHACIDAMSALNMRFKE